MVGVGAELGGWMEDDGRGVPARLAEAGNTWGPALAMLLSSGYTLSVDFDEESDRSDWTAESDDVRLSASNPLVLLGLAALWQRHGAGWREVRGGDILDRLLDGGTVTPRDARPE